MGDANTILDRARKLAAVIEAGTPRGSLANDRAQRLRAVLTDLAAALTPTTVIPRAATVRVEPAGAGLTAGQLERVHSER